MTSHYTWGSVTTLHDLGGVLGWAFRDFLLGSHNFMVTALSSCVKWPLHMVQIVRKWHPNVKGGVASWFMVVCSVKSASYSTLTYNCSSLVLIDAPITPNFPSSSNHENVGDYVQIRCWPIIFTLLQSEMLVDGVWTSQCNEPLSQLGEDLRLGYYQSSSRTRIGRMTMMSINRHHINL